MARKEFSRKIRQAAIDHGDACRGRTSPEYNIWVMMRQRCTNPNDKRYANYGGRGIVFVDRWSEFANFLQDLGRRPSPKHTLDRTDNDGPYSPANCAWATHSEQANNRSNNRVLSVEGRQITLAQASKDYGIPYSALKCRLRRGWSDAEAVELEKRRQTSGPRITKYSGAEI